MGVRWTLDLAIQVQALPVALHCVLEQDTYSHSASFHPGV